MTEKFRMWFKYGLKAQKLQKQHALNQRSPAEGKGKGQKLLAHGIALGIMAISKAPCKGIQGDRFAPINTQGDALG